MINPDGSGAPGDGPGSGGAGGEGGQGAGWIGALIQAGAGLYDSYQNRKASKENTDKTIAAQKAEAELAYQRSIEQWHMQNAYNTPEAQMQRFRAAGLNPHLVYGQGSPGNASSPAPYQPANMQYKYEAAPYGAALQSILPTLMSVGTWMQNMRLSQTEIQQKQTGTERTRQLIEYLMQANPRMLSQLDNRLSLFSYQKDIADYQSNIARTKLFEMEQDFRYKYGESLFHDLGSAWEPAGGKFSEFGGMKRLQFLQEQSKQKLMDAKASWSEFDITDPQALMQLVLSGVMGLAGQTLRLSNRGKSKVTHENESRMSTGRVNVRRRIYER